MEGPLAHHTAQVAPNRAPVARNIAPVAYNPGAIIFSHIHVPFRTLTMLPSPLLLLLLTASQLYFGKSNSGRILRLILLVLLC